jgi:hypothetical protein
LKSQLTTKIIILSSQPARNDPTSRIKGEDLYDSHTPHHTLQVLHCLSISLAIPEDPPPPGYTHTLVHTNTQTYTHPHIHMLTHHTPNSINTSDEAIQASPSSNIPSPSSLAPSIYLPKPFGPAQLLASPSQYPSSSLFCFWDKKEIDDTDLEESQAGSGNWECMLSSETSGFVGSIGVGVGACAESRMNLISRLVWGKGGGAVLEAMRTPCAFI